QHAARRGACHLRELSLNRRSGGQENVLVGGLNVWGTCSSPLPQRIQQPTEGSPDLLPSCSRTRLVSLFRSLAGRRGHLCACGRRGDERLEERRELAGPPEILRMPLYADAERRGRTLDRFDDAVG